MPGLQNSMVVEICVDCFCFVQFQGQSHGCPEATASDEARRPATEEFARRLRTYRLILSVRNRPRTRCAGVK